MSISIGQATGIASIFYLKFEQEARMMIGNFIPYLIYHEGKWIETLFSAESLMANSGNKWDENRGYIKWAYDNEFDYTAEDDPIISAIIEYMPIADIKTINSSALNTVLPHHPILSTLQNVLFGVGDKGSVSTLGSRKKHIPHNTHLLHIPHFNLQIFPPLPTPALQVSYHVLP